MGKHILDTPVRRPRGHNLRRATLLASASHPSEASLMLQRRMKTRRAATRLKNYVRIIKGWRA